MIANFLKRSVSWFRKLSGLFRNSNFTNSCLKFMDIEIISQWPYFKN